MAAQRAFRRAALALCMLLGAVSLPATVQANARESYLIRLLEGSAQFRVRVQSAISLGGASDSANVVKALTLALKDEHPAVRAAAANALGRVGNPKALPALRELEQDPEPPVRMAASAAVGTLSRVSASKTAVATTTPATLEPPTAARYYVAVGEPASRVAGVDGPLLAEARTYIQKRIAEIDGVLLAPGDESPRRVNSLLKARKLRGFYLDSAVTSVEPRPGGGTRVAVSVIVATYPGRDMRAIMHGAATAIGAGARVQQQALEGALTGALRKLPQAMEAAR